MQPDAGDSDVLDLISRIVRARRSGLAALARSEGVSAEDAVDCVQEALCTLLTSVDSAHAITEDEWSARLAVTVRNAARNRRRRHFRARPHEALDVRLEAADHAKADDAIARAEEHVRLRACVDELCETQKAVVTLRMLEEKDGEDVARALGISPGHVAVLLHRAKQALRVCMTGD
jgi:RNA polymerase sigma-70 factor (ECF subfamily)